MDSSAEKPDLDSREHIAFFVRQFYQRLLADELLGPIFLDVAQIDLEVHLPLIEDYWCKLLLGDRRYQRHTMNIHRELDARRKLEHVDFERWLSHFHATVNRYFSGPKAERARRTATTIAANMEESLRA